jgi:hypothetical protein
MPRKMAREPKNSPTEVIPTTSDAPAPRGTAKPSKVDLVLELRRRDTGATINELTEATSWLPHSARAVLTGLRKKGHAIERAKRGDLTCYHLSQAKA